MFANDTNLLFADRNLKSLETVVNVELMNVYDWLASNKLSLNVKKTNFVIFHPSQKRINYKVNLKIYDNNRKHFICLERKDYVKYLGVLIDSNLTWKHHISHTASKISKSVGIICRLRHLAPFSTLPYIYRSLIYPYLSYGLVAWGQAAKSHMEKILILQKRVVRLMNFAIYNSHAVPYFVTANFMPITANVRPINMLYVKLSSLLMHDVHNNLIPSNLSDMFTLSHQIHNHNQTRSSSAGNYYINCSRLNQHENSFSRIGCKIWNSIPGNLRNLPKHIFKEKITTILFQNLQVQDSYVDVERIISDMSKVKSS